MAPTKSFVKFIPAPKSTIFRCGSFTKIETIICAQKIEGSNYALTRTATGYPSITILRPGEFERLKSEGVKSIRLKTALKMQDEFLSR